MESVAVRKMFQRSTAFNNLQYTSYLGDGDCNSYSDVVKAQPYGPEVSIKKLECVGHVQKRVGSRLRVLRAANKGKLLSDNKRISGKGRLTDKIINSLQNFYGMSIRNNSGNFYGMKKAVAAIRHE